MPLSNPDGTTRTCILADDLTGACDAAAAFASRNIPTEVRPALNLAPSAAHVLAVNTATRDIAPAEAIAVNEALARNPDLDSFPHLFKKIDSVFRGNTFLEVAATVRAFPQRFAVIAPASPRHGRTCAGSHLHVEDLAGRTSTPLLPSFAAAGLKPVWLPSSADLEYALRNAFDKRAPAVFCEATSDEQLTAIVHAALALDRPILWIGSSGLAHALAAELHPASAPAPAPQIPTGAVLFITGSNHPVSFHQLTHLDANHSEASILRIERNHTTDEQIRAVISSRDITCLVLNGGDTALQTCRALAMTSLNLLGEFAPGIPVGIARGGPCDGATIILKSGGFGAHDLFTRILQLCAIPKAQPA